MDLLKHRIPVKGGYSKLVKEVQQKGFIGVPEMEGLFGHKVRIETGGMTFKSEALDIQFTVPFDDDAEANEAEITIYNLTKDTREKLKKDNKITIEAGYNTDTGVIFTGYITKRKTKHEGVDIVTTLYAIDSRALKERKIKSKSYKKGTKASTILKDLVERIKMPTGAFKIKRDYTYKDSVTVEGELMDSIKKYAQVCGVSTYVNKGKIYVRSLKEGDNIKFTVEPATGLLSVEEFEEEVTAEKYKDKIKGYKLSMLLQHRITTASIIKLHSKDVKGTFRVRSGEHTFDGTDMLTEIEVI